MLLPSPQNMGQQISAQEFGVSEPKDCIEGGGGRVFRSKFNLFALSCWMLIITKLHVGSSGALITLLLVLNGFHWADAM